MGLKTGAQLNASYAEPYEDNPLGLPASLACPN